MLPNQQQAMPQYLNSMQSWLENYSPQIDTGVPDINVGNIAGAPGAAAAAANTPPGNTGPNGMFESLFGYTNDQGNVVPGAGSQVLGAATGVANAYLGYRQFQLAKDSLKENKRQFNLNFESQKKLTNSRLEDRQRARVASNPGAYQSVGSYMNKNGI